MFIVLESFLKDGIPVPRHAHGPFHLYEDAQLAVDTYTTAVPATHPPTYFFTIMEVGNENEDEEETSDDDFGCQHNWQHDEAYDEFRCTKCEAVKGE